MGDSSDDFWQQEALKEDEAFEREETKTITMTTEKLQPIGTAPKDGTWILLFAPSGYGTTPLRCEVCRYYPEYRPLQPWQNHANDSFLDGGEAPTHWLPLPYVPK